MLAPQPIKSKKCLRCSRPLTNPVSMYVGFGPICSEVLGINRPDYEELLKLNPEDKEQLAHLVAIRQKLETANNIEGTVTLEDDRVIIKFPWGCQNFDAIKTTVKKFATKWNPQKKQWEAPKLQLPMLLEGLKVFSNLAIDESLFSNTDSVPPTSPDATTAISCPFDNSCSFDRNSISPSLKGGRGDFYPNGCLPTPPPPKECLVRFNTNSESYVETDKKEGTDKKMSSASWQNGINSRIIRNFYPTMTKLEALAAQMKKRLETVDRTNATLKNGLQLFLKRENGTYKVFCARENVLPSKVEIRVIGNSFFGKGQWEFGKAKTAPPLPTEGYVIQLKQGEK